jgi:tellurite methyltransferase
MDQDRERWNRKYRERPPSKSVSAIVKKYYRMADRGLALDLAAGGGRNALFLARRGFRVHAVDISEVGFLGLAARHPDLHPVVADLDRFDIPADRYNLIVNVRFLSRRLFPHIIEGLIPGGVLIFQTYLQDPDHGEPSGMSRDYLLRDNELLRSFLPLSIRYYSEAPHDEPHTPGWLASLVAMKR